ncbi:hypothetical protein ABGB12_12575 [Actinocorallia sp. B10E7]|uniref:hypothetical protein n=1 Tax=Actinocorallia sp. B10E7 TaxID=3153558 RepID=UPI00325F3D4C
MTFELDTETGMLSARACDRTGPRLRSPGMWDDARDVWVRGICGLEKPLERLCLEEEND